MLGQSAGLGRIQETRIDATPDGTVSGTRVPPRLDLPAGNGRIVRLRARKPVNAAQTPQTLWTTSTSEFQRAIPFRISDKDSST